jgi:hypothetical protein
MIHAYLNYPNSHGTFHSDAACTLVRVHRKEGQRVLRIDPASFAAALNVLSTMPFRSEADANDLWLEIDFNDLAFERAVAEFVVRRLGARYRPLARIELEEHC